MCFLAEEVVRDVGFVGGEGAEDEVEPGEEDGFWPGGRRDETRCAGFENGGVAVSMELKYIIWEESGCVFCLRRRGGKLAKTPPRIE